MISARLVAIRPMLRNLVTPLLLASLVSAQGGPAKVTVTKVVEHRFTPKIIVLGELEAKRTVDLGAEVAGRVAMTSFEEGDRLTQGEKLLSLDTRARAIQARGAKARLEAAAQQLAEYKAGSRPEEILEAESRVARTTALLEEAEENLERERGKQKSDIGSQKTLTVAIAVAASLRAERAAAQQQLALVRQGPRAEVIARAESDVALRQSELDAIEDEIEKAIVGAPFDCVVTKKRVGTGSYVRVGDAVASLVQIDPIRVTVSVPEKSVGLVTPGQKLVLRLDAFPGKPFAAEVKAVIPSGDSLARAFPVRLEMPNPDARLLPGMFVRAELPVGERRALAVPRDAVVTSARGSVVYTVVEGKAQIAPVTVGEVDGDLVEIRGPVTAGASVVLRGNDGLRPGSAIVVLNETSGR